MAACNTPYVDVQPLVQKIMNAQAHTTVQPYPPSGIASIAFGGGSPIPLSLSSCRSCTCACAAVVTLVDVCQLCPAWLGRGSSCSCIVVVLIVDISRVAQYPKTCITRNTQAGERVAFCAAYNGDQRSQGSTMTQPDGQIHVEAWLSDI